MFTHLSHQCRINTLAQVNQHLYQSSQGRDAARTLPWMVQSPGRDVLCSDTLGRTWMLPEIVSDAFLAKAKMGPCHRPSPPPLTALLLPLLEALSPEPDFSSWSLKIPNTCPLSLLLSASDRARSCSAADAMFRLIPEELAVLPAMRKQHRIWSVLTVSELAFYAQIITTIWPWHGNPCDKLQA